MAEDMHHPVEARPLALIERWWPQLSIVAKHRVLAELDGVLDVQTAREIEEITGAPAPVRLSPAEQTYVRTQIEPVD